MLNSTNMLNRFRLILIIFFLGLILTSTKAALAYEFAHYMIDARTGKFLYGKNYEKKLHPASLTKMMTLYLTFNELTANRLDLDDKVTISHNAAQEPSSKLWLSAGQRVSIRTLVRGAAIRSANDAATALAEHISGSEKKFADYMTIAAREMGMSRTVFKNAHGLTASNHLSSPKDMAILARRLITDFPQYYNLFGRTSVQTLGKTIYNTNRKFLSAYGGSDGIKTGYTSLAGYNLAASADREGVRIIGVIFGAGSVALRNKRMTELLDLGFAKAPMVVGSTTLLPINLRPDIINQIGKNSLLNLSTIPLSRPKGFFVSISIGVEAESQEIEQIVKEVRSSLMKETIVKPQVSDESFPTMPNIHLDIPPDRPKILMKDQVPVNVKSENKGGSGSVHEVEVEILVGFYYNRYNAEKDLPTILLSDASLLGDVTAEISKEIFRKKAGFRIKIFPLSKTNALRACTKIRASGELCDIPE